MNDRLPLWAWVGRLLALGVLSTAVRAANPEYFVIQVVDRDTGRGVPLVELTTVNHIASWTDSGGRVAFFEPGLMGRETFFHVRSPGYEHAKDGFGYHGLKLTPTPGGSATIRLLRTNIAERLYRITGQGIYRDTVLAGLPAPIREPLLNAQITGQDTVISTPYRGRIYWFWGDTDRIGYPLGNFGATGATSALPGTGGLDPSVGIDLEYLAGPNGFARSMCPQPDHGLRWIEGVMTVNDEKGRERLVARVAHHKDLGPALGWYLMVFDDEKGRFDVLEHWDSREGHDSSHPFRARSGGREYLYLYPNWRVPADLKSLRDPASYEAFTCVTGDSKWQAASTASIERDVDGRPRYSWKPGATRLQSGRIRSLVDSGALNASERWIDLRDPETGQRAEAGRGSVAWNGFRNRWVMVASGRAGEIWFAEADTPTGPWVYARKVLDHGDYNFYNPVHHAFLDQAAGRVIYFEGTYTAAFSGAKSKTPRYDYNQIMYRLTLDDPRLQLPAPVYRIQDTQGGWVFRMREQVAAENSWDHVEAVPFFALPPPRRGDRPRERVSQPSESGNTPWVPVFPDRREGVESLTSRPLPGRGVNAPPLFLLATRDPKAGESAAEGLAELCEFRNSDGRHLYALAGSEMPAGFQRTGEPLGWAWRNPQTVLALDPGAVASP